MVTSTTHSTHGTDRADLAIEVFIQDEGRRDVRVVQVPASATIADLIRLAAPHGTTAGAAQDVHISLSDGEESLHRQHRLSDAGIHHHQVLHCHRCTQVSVGVRYNGAERHRDFPPSATFRRIHAWATGPHGFNLGEIDAAEHILQVSGTADQPEPTDHLGSVTSGSCKVRLDLVAKARIEG